LSHIITRGFAGRTFITRGYGVSAFTAVVTVIGDLIFRRVKPTQIFSAEYRERIFKRGDPNNTG
jgi:hypothetical protein